MAEPIEYYYEAGGSGDEDGVSTGPCTLQEMRELYRTKALASDSRVWCADYPSWLRLSESPLYKLLQPLQTPAASAAPPATPPPPPKARPPSAAARPVSVAFKGAHGAKHESKRMSSKLSRRIQSKRFGAPAVAAQQIWIEESDGNWRLFTVLSQQDNFLALQAEDGTKSVIDVNFSELRTHNGAVVPDMTALHHLHEPAILHNLRVRCAEKSPYTYMGTVLIAVNPLEPLPMPPMAKYADCSYDPNAPHPYAIAEGCFQMLSIASSPNQSVVISGESGAGKTETAKILLSYLVERSQMDKSSLIDQKLLRSSRILESFGNAKSARNPNSSRFGKFMKIYFEQPSGKRAGALIGASIETYLLEKSRVVTQAKNERNFHVFYQLLAAAGGNIPGVLLPDRLVSALCDGQYSQFSITSAWTAGDNFDDNNLFVELRDALTTVGYDEAKLNQLWSIIAGVLVLGNVAFETVESASGPIAQIKNSDICNTAAELLGISVDDLSKILTERNMTTRGEKFVIPLKQTDAAFTRDAMCKYMYEAVFNGVLKSINDVLRQSSQSTERSLRFIGVLDVFGFESFEKNGLEQLLINYANETLQETFNKQVFEAELRLYEQENVEFTVSGRPDNKGCVELIAAKPKGLLWILDATCRAPKASDEKFCEDLHKSFVKDSYFPPTHPKDRKHNFFVKHYAGVVKYTVWSNDSSSAEVRGLGDMAQWVSKNVDALPDGIQELLSGSSNAVVSESLSACESGKKPAAKTSAFTKPTISASFCASMAELNCVLTETQCSFIRCIKPNAQMTAGIFDNKFVVSQIRSLGLVQACEVLRVGLPHRISYAELKASLSFVAGEVEELLKGESDEVFISTLFYGFDVPGSSYRLGRSRVFFKTGQLGIMHKLLSDTAPERKEAILARCRDAVKLRAEAFAVADASGRKAEEIRSLVVQHGAKCKDLEASLEASMQDPNVSHGHVHSAENSCATFGNLIAETKHMVLTLAGSAFSFSDPAALIDGIFKDPAFLSSSFHSRALEIASDLCKDLQQADASSSAWTMKLSNALNQLNNSSGKAKSPRDMCIQIWESHKQIEDAAEVATKRAVEARDAAIRCLLDVVAQKAAEVDTCLSTGTRCMQSIESMRQAVETTASNQTALVHHCGEVVNDVLKQCNDASLHHINNTRSQVQILKKLVSDYKDFKKAEEERIVREEAARIETERQKAETARLEAERLARKQAQEAEELARKQAEEAEELVRKEAEEASIVANFGEPPTIPPPIPSDSEDEDVEVPIEPPVIIQPVAVPERPVKPTKNSSQNKSVEAISASVSAIQIAEEVGTDVEHSVVPYVPPHGWTEYVDDDSGLIYYANDYTDETQWERPTKPAQPAGAPPNAPSDDDGLSVKSDQENIDEVDDTFVLPDPSIVQASTSSAIAMNSRVSTRLTNNQFEKLGMTTKTGILMEKSVMFLWKKRFVVLEGSKLMIYKDSEAYKAGDKKCKAVMDLSSESMTSFTAVKNCFSVTQFDSLSTGIGDLSASSIRSGSSENTKGEQWFFLAKDERDLHEWVTAISAHVHMVHVMSPGFQRKDYFAMGRKLHSFWRVPIPRDGRARLPVGIRTIPEFNGPRTGEGVYPGEIFEVVHQLDVAADASGGSAAIGNTFLCLADDRGWVFIRHPKYNTMLVERINGISDVSRFVCSFLGKKRIETRFGPSEDSKITGFYIEPGDTVQVAAAWTSDESHEEWFKLVGDRGWVARKDPVFKRDQFQK